MTRPRRHAWARAAQTIGRASLLITLLLCFVSAAHAQEVGTIAALAGSAELGRGGTWTRASLGAPIHQGDELRTGRPGRLRIVFQDDSVLTVSDDSHVVIDEQVFAPGTSSTRSVFGLLQGKIGALVSEYYHQAGTAYQIKTATAVAGVRGTEFVMEYHPNTDVTEIAGVSGRVEVHSVLDPTGHGVFVSAQEVTSVVRGQYPRSPRRVSDSLFRRYMEGVNFIGAGSAGSLTTNNALLAGATVPKPDRAGEVATGTTTTKPSRDAVTGCRDASCLLQQPPSIFSSGSGRLRLKF
jgi:hypothetical protein